MKRESSIIKVSSHILLRSVGLRSFSLGSCCHRSAPISCIMFDPYGKWLVVAVEKHIRIFHNVTGYRIALQDLEERRKVASNASLRERIQQQINEAR